MLPGGSASATHPCAQRPDGSTYDPAPTSDHDACPGSRPSPSPGDVQLTEADNNRTVTVPRYARVFVDLRAPFGQVWSDLSAGRELYRTYLDVQRASSFAVFSALSTTDGTQVTSTTDEQCLHAAPACAQPSQAWSVTVVVSSSPPPTSNSDFACARAARPDASPGVTVLDESSDGSTVTVAPGDAVLVAFASCGSGFDLLPATGGGTLFRYRARGADSGPASAVFRAVRTGTTTLRSTSDAACLHSTPTCAIPNKLWQVTVRVAEPCALTGPAAVAAGATVPLTGRVRPDAAVQVWFRRRGGTDFSVRRVLTADATGSFATSYVGSDDHRWYATSGACTTAAGLTQVLPTLAGPATVSRGASVSLLVTGPAGAVVHVWFHGPGADYALRRTGRLDAAGHYRTSYVASSDQRYYAVTGPDRRRSAAGLTQVR